ncbi:ribosomal RNA processing protein 7 [Scheffersomyces amazonensis]|uniref:ribosomal RNA processing protein 7 n=1 Tax=Scheffersomyces amazonensis TaxID=1078765 RepID=UPI00315D3870
MGVASEIKGFYVLPLEFPESKTFHYIYFKKHETKSSESTNSNQNTSLFVYNLPINTSITSLKKFFQDVSIGATISSFIPSKLTDYPEDVWLDLTSLTSDLELNNSNSEESESQKLPKNCGIIKFIDKSSFQLAFNSLKKLSAQSKPTKWAFETIDSTYYLKKYQNQILNSEEISTQVSQALIDFDKAEQDSINQIHSNLVDEDGFTMVVGSHRKTKAGILGKQRLAATVELNKAQGKLKKKEREDFYRFQLRERKKEEMNQLLLKFKEDQEKVRLMREKKRFRPY